MPATAQIKASNGSAAYSAHGDLQKWLPKEAVQFKAVVDNPSPESYDRELYLQRVEQAETASNIQKWLSSKICGKACWRNAYQMVASRMRLWNEEAANPGGLYFFQAAGSGGWSSGGKPLVYVGRGL
jgi:hypothetical protein